MNFSDIPRNPDNRMLRQFAGLWVMFFVGMALSEFFRNHNTTAAIVVGVLAISVGVPGLIFPRLLKPVFVGWMDDCCLSDRMACFPYHSVAVVFWRICSSGIDASNAGGMILCG